MAQDARELVSFLDHMKRKQAEVHLGFGRDKIISFMGTSGSPGKAPAILPRRLLGVDPDEEHGAIAIRFAGALPRTPGAGENVALTLIDVPGYRGFQLKTTAAPGPRAIASMDGATRVTCAHAYTVRAEPSAASFFERIPVGEVAAVGGAVRNVLVAVGPQANISPRFIYQWQPVDEGVALFHGDAFLNKTYLNVQRNRSERRLVLDLDGFSGYALDTYIEDADPRRDAAVIERISACFAAAGFRANRVYRTVATGWKRVVPTA